MHFVPIAQCLGLIAAANIVPPVARILVGSRFSRPLDGGRVWVDGRPLFGKTKTVRGVVLAVLAGALIGYVMGVGATLGAAAAIAAMAGDIASSFCKRRLGLRSSVPAPGLDQIPESLLPAIVCAAPMSLLWYDVVMVVALFAAGDAILSPDYRRWRFPWEWPAGSAG